MTLNELDVQIDIEITEEQMRANEEIIISTPQGRIAYTLTTQTQLNKIYRFKGKGNRRIGGNVADEVGNFYVKFILISDVKTNGMERMPAVTMKWVIHYTDGDTWEQNNTYPYDYDTLRYKRKKIIEECVMIYGDNIDYIDFTVIVCKGVETKLDRYWHRENM